MNKCKLQILGMYLVEHWHLYPSSTLHVIFVTFHSGPLTVDKIRRRAFLWKGSSEVHGNVCLINWSQVYKPKTKGSLSIRDICPFNISLLSKWWEIDWGARLLLRPTCHWRLPLTTPSLLPLLERGFQMHGAQVLVLVDRGNDWLSWGGKMIMINSKRSVMYHIHKFVNENEKLTIHILLFQHNSITSV